MGELSVVVVVGFAKPAWLCRLCQAYGELLLQIFYWNFALGCINQELDQSSLGSGSVEVLEGV